MFKSIEFLKHFSRDRETNICSALFKIIDDDFEEEIVGSGDDRAEETDAIINIYSSKNLNVPKNLLLFFIFYEKEHGTRWYSIEQQIGYCMKYQPLFPKYKEDVEKYLTLM